MKFRNLLLMLALASSSGCFGQNIIESLERDVPGQGKVTIHQDLGIGMLLGKRFIISEQGQHEVLRAAGYRIQAYAGNNTRQSKNEAYQIAEQIKTAFPELVVYTSFNPPRWLCRVGDFRSIEEADAVMRKLKATGDFKEVAIVRDQIVIPLNF